MTSCEFFYILVLVFDIGFGAAASEIPMPNLLACEAAGKQAVHSYNAADFYLCVQIHEPKP